MRHFEYVEFTYEGEQEFDKKKNAERSIRKINAGKKMELNKLLGFEPNILVYTSLLLLRRVHQRKILSESAIFLRKGKTNYPLNNVNESHNGNKCRSFLQLIKGPFFKTQHFMRVKTGSVLTYVIIYMKKSLNLIGGEQCTF